jgi:hypothetical protein
MEITDPNQLRICPTCKKYRRHGDFFGKKQCYKCIYDEKTKGIIAIIYCKFCEKDIPKTRTKFCSEDCQKAFNDKQNKACWWKKITTVKINFKTWN